MTDLNVTAELEVDDSGTSRQFSVNDLKPAQTGAASEATLAAGLGSDGTSPPTLPNASTGLRGWLRLIYNTLSGTLTTNATISGTVPVSGPATDAQLRATPLPVTGTVTATVDETTLAKDATLTTLVGGPGSGVATITGSGSGIQGLLRMIWDTLRGSIAVTGTFWQATQPVSLATNTPDVTDRAGRLVGHVTVDSAPTTAVTAASLPLPSGAAQDGTDISSPTAMPAGGIGIRGWLSAIWTKLNGTLAVSGTFWQATQPVSVASTVTVDRPTATATLTNVASSVTTGTLLASNASRKAFTIFNDSTAVLYVKFGTTASATSYTVQIAAGGYYEAAGWNYTGRIDGLWSSANGSARVTELS